MILIGFNQDWTIHREGCREAVDLDVVGEFQSIADFKDYLIATKHTFYEELSDLSGDEFVKWIKYYVKPCTELN